MFGALRIGVVIPAYNEHRAIAATVSTLPDFVDDVIVVDDASRDDTSANALRSGRAHLYVIRHVANRGVGAAIATGYRRALELGVDVAVVMGGDGQMDPADLPALLAPIADGTADYVKGNRLRHPELLRAMPATRIAGNVMMSLATRVTSGYRHVFDSQCGYTAIHRDTLARLPIDELFPRYGYPNDLLARLHVIGARVVDVPVRPIYGEHWKSGINLRTIVHPIPWVLLRSWVGRVAAQTFVPRRYVPSIASVVANGFAPQTEPSAVESFAEQNETQRARTQSGGVRGKTGSFAERIGVVTTSYPRFAGDPAGGFVAGHVEALRALGHRVDVIAAGDGVDRIDEAASRITDRRLFYRGGAPDLIEASPLSAALAAVAFTGRLTATVATRARDWDSIITHWLVPSAIAALPTGLPVLAIAHGGDIHTLRRMRLLAPTLYALRARGARIAFVSEQLRAIARAEAPGLSSWLDDAIVQPMGIAIERFRSLSRAPSDPPTLVVASRLVPVKGIDVAIAAMAHVRAPARLVIAGEGPARSTLARHASDRITFLGQVPTSERDQLLCEASAVIVPSRITPSGRTEGTPTIALEALAAGVPVIASAVGGLRELSEIRLVPPDDPRALASAIDHTLADPPPANRLRAAVAHLDWQRVVAQLR